jgi:hypothetical protein
MNTIEQDFEYTVRMYKACKSINQIEYAKKVRNEFMDKWVLKINITDQKFISMVDVLLDLEQKKLKEFE